MKKFSFGRATIITADVATLFRQAPMTIDDYLNAALEYYNKHFTYDYEAPAGREGEDSSEDFKIRFLEMYVDQCRKEFRDSLELKMEDEERNK